MFEAEVRPVYDESLDDYQELTLDRFNSEILDSWVTEYVMMLGNHEMLTNISQINTYPRVC